jgi:hypothetical protein
MKRTASTAVNPTRQFPLQCFAMLILDPLSFYLLTAARYVFDPIQPAREASRRVFWIYAVPRGRKHEAR